MKIQLDTTAKIIKVEESVTFGELTEFLEKLLPNGLWKEFKLETNTIINWSSPTIIREYPPHRQLWRDWPCTPYCSDTTDNNRKVLMDGVYNVEL